MCAFVVFVDNSYNKKTSRNRVNLLRIGQLIAIPLNQKSVRPRQDDKNPLIITISVTIAQIERNGAYPYTLTRRTRI